jgi:hypothetical protein
MKTKQCTKCGEKKPSTTDYFTKSSRSKKDGLHPQCKECKNTTVRRQLSEWRKDPEWVARQKAHLKKHRETADKDPRRDRALARKLKFIEMKGGCCEKCGYDKNIGAFDFHHTNPKERSISINARTMAYAGNEQELLEELEKCQLLCANCHREEHYPQLEGMLEESKKKKDDQK